MILLDKKKYILYMIDYYEGGSIISQKGWTYM